MKRWVLAESVVVINIYNPATMLYALNFYSDTCQLFLNKTGKETTSQEIIGISLGISILG